MNREPLIKLLFALAALCLVFALLQCEKHSDVELPKGCFVIEWDSVCVE